jgi:hypothetical protein
LRAASLVKTRVKNDEFSMDMEMNLLKADDAFKVLVPGGVGKLPAGGGRFYQARSGHELRR